MALTVVKTTALSGTITNAQLAGSIDLTAKVTGTLPTGNGGTGSTATTFVNMTSNVTGTLPVGNGGSGRTAVTGNVLQVVSGYNSNPYMTTSSETLQTTAITVTLTPSATSSKIFIISSFNAAASDGDATPPIIFLRKNVGGGGDEGVNQIDDIAGWQQDGQSNDYIGANFLDSPSTTSEIVYYVQLATRVAGQAVYVGNYYSSGNKGGATMTAFEIAG